MDARRALVMRRSLEYEDIDIFRKCRSLYQKIGFVLDKWEESAGELCPRISRQEVLSAEKCLDETEKKLWRIVACQMTGGGAITAGPGQGPEGKFHSSDQRKHPISTQMECVQREVLTSRPSSLADNQVVAVQRCVQVQNVAVQHAESLQPNMLTINSNQQLVNLLLDWCILLEENGLHVEGMLLNEGHWKTSPIAVRVGPTTVKTSSGTTYNVRGEINVPKGVKLPDFVYNKFRQGFPSDWQQVVCEWKALIENEKRREIQQRNDSMVRKSQVQFQNALKSQGGAANNSRLEKILDKDKNKMPPPSRTTPHDQKRTQGKEDMDPRGHMSRCEVRISPMRRTSNRVLIRSLMDSSLNGTQSLDMSMDVNSLKKWSAEFIQETGELVLVGQLVSESHHVIDRNFTSSCVIRRMQADLIETADGEIYRLIGPANSEMKLFIHGFPLRWKDCLKRGRFPVKTATTNAKASRKSKIYDRAPNPSQDIDKNSLLSSDSQAAAAGKQSPNISSNNRQKRASQIIQQLVRHNIKQSQNTTVGSRSNQSVMSKKNDSMSSKRKYRNLLPLETDGPLKKMRTDDVRNNGGGSKSQPTGSEADVSSQSEQNAKQSRVKNSHAGKDKKPEEARSVMQSSLRGKSGTSKKMTFGSQLNTTGKYLPGMSSDVGIGQFNFDIF